MEEKTIIHKCKRCGKEKICSLKVIGYRCIYCYANNRISVSQELENLYEMDRMMKQRINERIIQFRTYLSSPKFSKPCEDYVSTTEIDALLVELNDYLHV